MATIPPSLQRQRPQIPLTQAQIKATLQKTVPQTKKIEQPTSQVAPTQEQLIEVGGKKYPRREVEKAISMVEQVLRGKKLIIGDQFEKNVFQGAYKAILKQGGLELKREMQKGNRARIEAQKAGFGSVEEYAAVSGRTIKEAIEFQRNKPPTIIQQPTFMDQVQQTITQTNPEGTIFLKPGEAGQAGVLSKETGATVIIKETGEIYKPNIKRFVKISDVDMSKFYEPPPSVLSIPSDEPITPYKQPIPEKTKSLVNEYKRDPQKFIRSHSRQVSDYVIQTINRGIESQAKDLEQRENVLIRTGEQEQFFGVGYETLMPYEQQGTAEVTGITFLSDEKLGKKYPFGAISEITRRRQAKLDFESSKVINKYIQQFQQEYESKIQLEVNSIDRESLTEEQYKSKVKKIIDRNTREFASRVENASKGELDKLTSDAQSYVKSYAKDLRVAQAIALVGPSFVTGAALSFGLGILPRTVGTTLGIGLGIATLSKTPEIVKSARQNPLAFGIETGSFLAGGFAGGEALRLKAGEPTITGRAVKGSVKITKDIIRNINKNIDDVAAGRQKYLFSGGAEQAFQLLKKTKKKKTPLDKLGEELSGVKNDNLLSEIEKQRIFNEKLKKIDEVVKEGIKKLTEEEKIKILKDYDTFLKYLEERGVMYKEEVFIVGEPEAKNPISGNLYEELNTLNKQNPLTGEMDRLISKTKSSTKGEFVSKGNQFSGYKSSSGIFGALESAYNSKSKNKSKTKTKSAGAYVSGLDFSNATADSLSSVSGSVLKEESISKSASSLLTGQATTQASSQQPVTSLTSFSFPGESSFPRRGKPKPKSKIKPFPFLFAGEKEPIRKEQAYYGYVKRGKKWKKVTPKKATRRAAADYASEAVDRTVSAQWKISPVKKKIKGKEKFVMVENKKLIQPTGYWSQNKYKFRQFKQSKGVRTKIPRGGIELQKYRIDSPGEKLGLKKARKGVGQFFGF